jgi:hypothetical protein
MIAMGMTADAEKLLRGYASLHDDCFDAWFMLAGISAQKAQNDDAMQYLIKALDTGFTDMDAIEKQPLLKKIYDKLNKNL